MGSCCLSMLQSEAHTITMLVIVGLVSCWLVVDDQDDRTRPAASSYCLHDLMTGPSMCKTSILGGPGEAESMY